MLSILDDIDELNNRPAVAVLPLGTGNDLSRVLGWGKQSDGCIVPSQVAVSIVVFILLFIIIFLMMI